MTKIGTSTFLATALLTAVVAASRHAAAGTVMRVAGSSCESGPGAEVWSGNDSNPDITQAEATAGAGRFRGLASDQFPLVAFCPVVDIPAILDITNTSIADRVSVLIAQGVAASNNPGRAQLCSEDNSGSTMGGSCGAAVHAPSGAGVRTVEFTMTSQTNWQVNPSSLHYIYVFVPSGQAGIGNNFFPVLSGYTIWHS